MAQVVGHPTTEQRAKESTVEKWVLVTRVSPCFYTWQVYKQPQWETHSFNRVIIVAIVVFVKVVIDVPNLMVGKKEKRCKR